MKHVVTLLALSLLSAAVISHAEENTPTEAAQELIAPARSEDRARSWEIGLDGGWLPKSDSSDAGGSVGITEAKVKVSRSLRINERWSLTPEFAYSILHISAPYPARLPENLHSLTAGIRADFMAGRDLSFNFLLAPGLASDFKGSDRKDLRVRLGSTVRYKASPKWTLLGGLIYQQGYRSLPVLPVIGAIYRPDERWTLSLAFPRPRASYAVSKDLQLYAGGEMSGGEYQLHEQRLGAKIVRYRDFRLVGGTEFTVFERLRAELSAGYALARKFTFYDNFDPIRSDLRIAPAPFVRAGLKMEW